MADEIACRRCGHRMSLHTETVVVVDGVIHGTCAFCEQVSPLRPACTETRSSPDKPPAEPEAGDCRG